MSQPVEQTVNETVNDDESVVEFVPLKGFEDDYEILNQYPFTIRKKSNHYVLKETINSVSGYVQVHLNRKPFRKHRLICLQFLENPDPVNFDVIDHVNHDKTDNHLSNLRWTTQASNNKNKSSCNGVDYEYVNEISDESIVVNEYNNHQFNNYYFHENIFYFFNGIQYRKLHIIERRNGSLFVNMIDNDGKRVRVMYSKFKRLHDLL